MTNTSFATLGTLALLAAGTAFGQTKLTADIPFEFSFANRAMPAGSYEITRTPGVLQVRNYSTGAAANGLTNNIGGGNNQNTESRLVFDKYGDKYFLAEIWSTPGSGWAIAVSKSKAERELAGVTPEVARVIIPVRGAKVASLRQQP